MRSCNVDDYLLALLDGCGDEVASTDACGLAGGAANPPDRVKQAVGLMATLRSNEQSKEQLMCATAGRIIDLLLHLHHAHAARARAGTPDARRRTSLLCTAVSC